MSALVFFSSAFVFALITGMFYGVGKRIDNKERRIKSISGKHFEEIDEDLDTPFLERFFVPAVHGLLKFFSRLFPAKKQKDVTKLEKYLKLAGLSISTGEYSAARLMVIISITGVSVIAAYFVRAEIGIKFLIAMFGMCLAVIMPTRYLSTRIKTRQRNIRNQMPDILDLLTVSVEAGLSFDSALLKVGERMNGPLVEELTVVQREIQMSLPRREALKNLTERSNVPELKTFVGAIIQSDQLGLPLKNVLRAQSAQLRLTRKQVAEEKAMKAPIKMMLPLIMFVFPVIFIVLLGPTVLQLIETFGK